MNKMLRYKIHIYSTTVFLAACALLVVACAPSSYQLRESGVYYWTASYYAKKFHGRPTASGEIFNMYGKTAAHKRLPFGTRLKVTNTANGRSVFVTVNDRGPFIKGRQLDLSYGAAKEVDMLVSGTARVRVEILTRDVRYMRKVNFLSFQGPFTVQVGSFREEENAVRLENILKDGYRNVYIERVSLEGDDYFRVCVGKFQDKKPAERLARKLADEGYSVIVITWRKGA